MTYVAHMETEHFDFVAIGRTEDEAWDALVSTMQRHREQYGGGFEPEHYLHSVDSHLGAGDEVPHPDTDPRGWLRWLAEDYYGAGVTGPYAYGEAGTRDHDFITIRGEK